MSDDKRAVDLCEAVGQKIIELVGGMVERREVHPAIALTGTTGAIAALAHGCGVPRANVIAALNSAFDDIEAGDK